MTSLPPALRRPNAILKAREFLKPYLQAGRSSQTQRATLITYKLEFEPEGKPDLATALRPTIHDHYADVNDLARALDDLNHQRAAKIVRDFAPSRHRLRFGDLGEILLVRFIEDSLGIQVPLRRLRQRENREVPLPGDDAVGVVLKSNLLTFIKGEAKARKTMQGATLTAALKALNGNGGAPSSISVYKIMACLQSAAPGPIVDAIRDYYFGDKKAEVQHITLALYERIATESLSRFSKQVVRVNRHYIVGIEMHNPESIVRAIYEAAIRP